MLYSWKMVLKRRRMTLCEYVYQTKVVSIEELSTRLEEIGASCPSKQELTQMATTSKPESATTEAWTAFKNLVLPPKPKLAKIPTSTPEIKNVRKRKAKRSQPSTDKKIRSSS